MSAQSLGDIHRGRMCVCVYRGECACVVSACDCMVLLKQIPNIIDYFFMCVFIRVSVRAFRAHALYSLS